MTHVSHIYSVQVIMILDILAVCFENIIHKVCKFLFIYHVYKVMLQEHI